MSRPAAYKGDEPYIFVSYCHKDDARVWPMIEGLQARGMRVWYDEGIEWGSHWDQVIFDHLSGCTCVVAFVTESFLQSENCQDEISYAKDERKGPFIVFLDNLELTGLMKFRYGRIQALNLHQFAGADALLDALVQTRILAECIGADIQPALQQTERSDTDPEECYRRAKALDDEKKNEEAFVWYHKAAELGHIPTQCHLGYCYLNGHGVAKNEAEAVKWYRRAAEQGRVDVQHWLGTCYEDGRVVCKDDAEASKWYRKAAEQGYAAAQCNLGVLYFYGKGVSKDEAEAVEWYRKAAEQGYAQAQYNLGYCYQYGIDVAQDDTEAAKWYRKAGERGHGYAQAQLGRCYLLGEGVAEDEMEAVRWFRKAAEQGNALGQCGLGGCYETGRGVSINEAEAVKWYRMAAEQGYADAQEALRKRGQSW